MTVFRAGRYGVRLAAGAADVRRCQELRHLAFIEGRGLGPRPGGLDRDEFDALCRHVMVEEAASGALVCCFRILPLGGGSEIGLSYAARHYDLGRLARFPGRMLEMGRFCLHPAWRDPGIVRAAWGALARHVEATGAGLVFGCSSFHGVDAGAYLDAFALLRERHLAPRRWLPRPKAPRVFAFARQLGSRRPDPAKALRAMPPLLRSYLMMGGWVSDHAVIDAELDTLHVFTGVEIARVPEARARLLRRAA
jgi:putative hemolysin